MSAGTEMDFVSLRDRLLHLFAQVRASGSALMPQHRNRRGVGAADDPSLL